MAAINCTQEEMEQRACAELSQRNQRDDINRMMKVSFSQCSAKDCFLELSHQPENWETNIFGTLHGGLIAFLLDATMAITCRAYTGDRFTPTLDIQVRFLRPVHQESLVYTRATILHAGRNVIQLTAELWEEDRTRLCASASASFYRADK